LENFFYQRTPKHTTKKTAAGCTQFLNAQPAAVFFVSGNNITW